MNSPAASVATDPLAGISEKTTKSDMLKRLNELADTIRGHERKRTGRLAEIEERVRSKYKPGDVPELHNVVFTATNEEWAEAIEFLDNFEDLLPVALQRVLLGGRTLQEMKDKEKGK